VGVEKSPVRGKNLPGATPIYGQAFGTLPKYGLDRIAHFLWKKLWISSPESIHRQGTLI
jgi:hypothetical protein